MKTQFARTEAELRAAAHAAFESGMPVLVAGDRQPPAGFGGLVLEVATRGVDVNTEGCHVDDLVFCGGVTLTLAAGESWRDIVTLAVQNGWAGVEALAALPGTVGDVVAANAEVFGQSVSDVVASVRTWDRAYDSQKTFAMVDCEFAPSSSRFSRELLDDGMPRYIVIEVSLLLKQADITAPIDDPGLVSVLGIRAGDRVPLERVQAATSQAPGELWTIGHWNCPEPVFIAALEAVKIQVVADVRSSPGSRRSPQFGGEVMPGWLGGAGIGYRQMSELGGRRRKQIDVDPLINAGWENDSFKNYADYTLTPAYEEGLERLMALARQQRVAIMCGEPMPWRCHRSLVSNTLVARGWTVWHLSTTAKPKQHELGRWGAPAHVEDGVVTYPPQGS